MTPQRMEATLAALRAIVETIAQTSHPETAAAMLERSGWIGPMALESIAADTHEILTATAAAMRENQRRTA